MLAPNPRYGSGVFRRRVRVRVAARVIEVDLEDSNHAFRLAVRHDGERLMAIEPDYVRHPFTTCPESGVHLAGLAGRALHDLPEARRLLETRVSCTHLVDMLGLALAHLHETGFACLYDIAVDDEREGRTRARISCDGEPVHDWTIAQHAIVEPETLLDRPMLQGFHAWAREAFDSRPFEAALMLQRGYFVAQARRYSTDPEREHPAAGDGVPDGVCYSYSTPVVARARRIEGSKRNFTNDADALLRFEREPRDS